MTGGGRRDEATNRWSVILASLFVALILRTLPWSGWGLWLRPDFLLVTVLFWAHRAPGRAGLGLAWLLGLLTDFQQGIVLGQYALAYVLAVYLVQLWQRRLVVFSLLQQSLHIFAVLLLVQVVALATGWISGRPPVDGMSFLSTISGALLWYALMLGSRARFAA